jgi:Mg2+-importing ATPase
MLVRRVGMQPRRRPLVDPAETWWSWPAEVLLERLRSTPDGLSGAEAAERLRLHGSNTRRAPLTASWPRLVVAQLRSPLLLLLVFAAVASSATGQWVDAAIVIGIVVATAGIGSAREYGAQGAAAALQRRLRTQVRVRRDGAVATIDATDLVPGDVVLLGAGAIVPADAAVLDATDLYVSEAVLTGESFPVAKTTDRPAADAPLRARTNGLFCGTNVRSGTAACVVVATGGATVLAAIERKLRRPAPETDFERGLRRFGYLLTSAMLAIALAVFVANLARGASPVDTLLFAIALAVGLSPELLPAILAVNLSQSAQAMARRGVLVRHLTAIENLGSMDVLCTDKTGTLTEGVVRLEGAYDADGQPSTTVLAAAAVNAALESGISSPLDDAITAAHAPDLRGVTKLAEVPFDFVRRRVTVVVETPGGVRVITKGSFHEIVSTCTRTAAGHLLDEAARRQLAARFDAWTSQGIRVLAVAEGPAVRAGAYGRDDERDLAFLGFLTFLDAPRSGVADAIRGLARLGVAVKIISGDCAPVACHVARQVGVASRVVLTGAALDAFAPDALPAAAAAADVFAEVDPAQKERIILALKRAGHVVGFLGDGVNDAPAMHAADTSLAVEQAVDVAREAADFVLLERGLDVIGRGIAEGRRTFANTLKYILITTSANLGNMLSMGAVSLVLPFLPLTAGQVLLNNLLSDVPAVGLASDDVDPELVERPPRWDVAFIGRYMVEFGAVSSAFDLCLFAALIVGLRAHEPLFQTAWFVESLLTELAIALVVRTRRPFLRSRPGRLLLVTTAAVAALGVAVPYLPGSGVLGFVPLPPSYLALIAIVTASYLAATEVQKAWFYRRMRPGSPS